MNKKAVIFEILAIAVGGGLGVFFGDYAHDLPALLVFLTFFWFSYGINYLASRLFPDSQHWSTEIMASPPVMCLVAGFFLSAHYPMDDDHMMALVLSAFLALNIHFYEVVIRIMAKDKNRKKARKNTG